MLWRKSGRSALQSVLVAVVIILVRTANDTVQRLRSEMCYGVIQESDGDIRRVDGVPASDVNLQSGVWPKGWRIISIYGNRDFAPGDAKSAGDCRNGAILKADVMGMGIAALTRVVIASTVLEYALI
jgi:hypothetical protein